MRWSGAPRKAGYRQIEAAPEEMHGADLAEVARAEALQHPISSDRGVEETRHGLDVVGSIGVVLNEWNRVGHFIGTAVEVRRAADRTEQIAEAPWKSATDIGPMGNSARRPSVAPPLTVWSRRSKTISIASGPSGTSDVVKPRALT